VSDEVNFVLRARREKLSALEATGVQAFAYGFSRTHDTAGAVVALGSAAEGPVVRVAGRVVSWRGQGKTIFAHLADMSGRVQLYFRRDDLGEEAFARLKLFDIGDVIGVEGPMFRTRTGEATVRVDTVEMLAKSLQ
jgi:lysyl-tRNA synthetase, class II